MTIDIGNLCLSLWGSIEAVVVFIVLWINGRCKISGFAAQMMVAQPFRSWPSSF
jgi:hypothetical protein